jgi:large conductance mechanosensitive channel
MLKGFRDFVMRGNVVDLAVAVVIGAAFSKIVTALVSDFINPLLAAFVGKPDFTAFFVIIHGGKFMYGDFITQAINFLLIAAAVYFFVVLPLNTVMKRLRRDAPPAPVTTKPCPECLSEIPLAAHRCSHCAQPVGAV